MSDIIEKKPQARSPRAPRQRPAARDAKPVSNAPHVAMTAQAERKSPAIYQLNGDDVLPQIADAAAMAFNAICLPAAAMSPVIAAAAREAGLDVLLEISLSEVAAESPLLAEHPEWIVHANGGSAFFYLSAEDASVGYWDEQIALWQETGVAGFRCRDVVAVLPAIWTRLIAAAKARSADVIFIAEVFAATSAQIMHLRDVGFSYGFSSSCWWDFRGAWLDDNAASIGSFAAVMALAAPPGTQAWPLAARRRALQFAAAYSAGWLVEAGFCKAPDFDLAEEVRALNGLRNERAVLRQAPPARLVSSAGSDVAVLARGDLVVAANASLAVPAKLPASGFLPALGVVALAPVADDALDLIPGTTLALAPGELRLFSAAATVQKVFLPVAIPLDCDVPRIAIEAISPQVDAGQFPVRRTVGEMVEVAADLIADGHDKLAGELQFRAVDETVWRAAPLTLLNNDRWLGSFPLERMGRYVYTISAWKDLYATFVDEVTKKHAAGVPITLELQEGINLITETKAAAAAELQGPLGVLLDGLQGADEAGRLETMLSGTTIMLMRQADQRKFLSTSHEIMVDAERLGASFASWYEVFPRSQSGDESRHGTFHDVIANLPRIAGMGFDVLYFPPIHPIGRTNRKGRNNTLTPAPDDPGSPYAIGADEGGHDALHPELGTLDDFRAMIAAAKGFGIEIAIDFAIQCAPDHPWLKQHPEWFDWRPDGSLRYAENPPKKYEDIVNVDFYTQGAKPALWIALRDAVQFWVNQGVKLFRVDNPHTKPLPFWEWLIGDIRSRHPDAIFLAEAFTRPKVMYRLAKIGFAQSYTYFTWRNTKAEIEEYLAELTTTAPKDFFGPHFFVNTPDINPAFLQTGGRGGHLIRAALAATLSGLWGVYNGFELCEATVTAPGKEEYLNSEKYQLRAWDYEQPGNIIAEITRLNRIRKTNAALHSFRGLEFLPANNDQVVYFRKFAPDGNTLLVAISLDPRNVQDATIEVPLWRFGIPDDGAIEAEDLMREFKFTWHGKYQSVRLNPYDQPFCIWRISPPII